jgi:hypothetical protein
MILGFIRDYFKNYQNITVLLSSLLVVAVIIRLISNNSFALINAQNQTIQITKINHPLPVEGYDQSPPCSLTAVIHAFDDPNLRVYHFSQAK